jgi:hypothetical protein
MQRYIIHLFLQNSLHVSGGSSAHHQEHRVFSKLILLPATTSSSKIVAGSSISLEKNPMLYVQFSAPDDGRRIRLKHVEHFAEVSKLCNVASCWLSLEIEDELDFGN